MVGEAHDLSAAEVALSAEPGPSAGRSLALRARPPTGPVPPPAPSSAEHLTTTGGTTAAPIADAAPPVPAPAAGRAFLAWGAAAYAAVLAIVLLLALREAGGHLVYVLDDPAIHQAVATNLVEHGTWGVVPGHFESASSSPLWTLLLAAWLAVTPGGDVAGPLLLNAVAAVALIAVLGANQVVLRPSRRRPAHALAVVGLVTIVLFLPGLTLVGMEHVLHMALVLGAVVLAHRQDAGELARWPRWAPAALLALATLARLETAFVAAALVVATMARCLPGWGPGGGAAPWARQLARAAGLWLAAVVPFALVAVATRLGGQGWLPNSVAAKSQSEPTAPPLYRAATERFTADPLVAVLAIVAAVAVVLAWRAPRRFVFPAVTTVVAVVLHMTFARIGWYERYQGYLVAIGVYALLQLVAEVRSPVDRDGARGGGARAGRGALAVLALLPFCGTKLFLTVDVGLANADTYEQRYQVGRFLAEHYAGEPVATGELGYVSLLHEGPVTDLFGLGDHEVLRERLRVGGPPDAAYWEALLRERGVDVVAVYPSTLGLRTPASWTLAGTWTLPRRTVTAFEPRFEFWATSPEALVELRAALESFAPELPTGVDAQLAPPPPTWPTPPPPTP